MEQYKVNVSAIQDFYQCRFRWWCKWVMNRVPVAGAPALDAGKLLHVIFEDHFNGKGALEEIAKFRCREFRGAIPMEHPAARPALEKAVTQIEDLIEALPLWEEKYPITKVLEVEEPFEYQDRELSWLVWRGRPDRMVVIGKNTIYHEQNRGLASSMNFGTYVRLQKRSYHEHLYGERAFYKWCRTKKYKYGGTLFNLVRKLKFRTNVGKSNEATKTAEEMFHQMPAPYNMEGGLHEAVMHAMRVHVTDMLKCERQWALEETIPAPNEKMNGGYGGNSEDPYFKVLIGECTLEDDDIFKDREDTYAITEAE